MLNYVQSLKEGTNDIKNLISALSSGKVMRIGLDTETTSLDPLSCELLLVQIKIDDGLYVLNRGGLGKKFLTNLLNLINEHNIECIGHNIKFDYKVLRHDTDVKLKKIYDTMVCESVLTAGIGEKLTSLKTLIMKYCNVEISKSERLEFIDMHQDSTFTEQQINYSATDVLYLDDIYQKQILLGKEANLTKVINLEMDDLPVVADMEYQGIPLDVDHWKKLSDESERKAKIHGEETKALIIESIKTSKYKNALEFADALCIPVKSKKARSALESITDPSMALQWIKDNFNEDSPKQLTTALNLAGVKTTSTNAKVLNKLSKNPIIDALLEYREFQKQVSTYGYNIIDLINPVTGRIHTEYFPVGTVTGRFSSSGPNLQNMPVHGGYREGFVSRPGFSFLAVDYSQQEFRLVGAISREPRIIEAYVLGKDMHTATAANRFRKSLDDVTKDERNIGKTINFAVIYGTTEYGLKRNFNISLEEAVEMLKEFYDGYPVLTAFKKAAEDKIVELGYSVTPLGRRRYFKPKPVFGTPYEIEHYYSQMKREGFNLIFQGGGADVTKIALHRLGTENPFGEKYLPLLQVHDEIVAEVHDSILDQAFEFMTKTMRSAFQPFLGEIPAVVDGKFSKRWTK